MNVEIPICSIQVSEKIREVRKTDGRESIDRD